MMRGCPSCGAPNLASARFCTTCGTALEALEAPTPAAWMPPPPAHATGARTPGTAIVSLIMGLMTWLLPFALIGLLTFWVTAPVAVATGVSARRRINAEPEVWKGGGMAMTGLTLGLSALVLATLIESLWVLARLS